VRGALSAFDLGMKNESLESITGLGCGAENELCLIARGFPICSIAEAEDESLTRDCWCLRWQQKSVEKGVLLASPGAEIKNGKYLALINAS
jgi:hypothetical protein